MGRAQRQRRAPRLLALGRARGARQRPRRGRRRTRRARRGRLPLGRVRARQLPDARGHRGRGGAGARDRARGRGAAERDVGRAAGRPAAGLRRHGLCPLRAARARRRGGGRGRRRRRQRRRRRRAVCRRDRRHSRRRGRARGRRRRRARALARALDRDPWRALLPPRHRLGQGRLRAPRAAAPRRLGARPRRAGRRPRRGRARGLPRPRLLCRRLPGRSPRRPARRDQGLAGRGRRVGGVRPRGGHSRARLARPQHRSALRDGRPPAAGGRARRRRRHVHDREFSCVLGRPVEAENVLETNHSLLADHCPK